MALSPKIEPNQLASSRPVSFPVESNPIVTKISKELGKLKRREESSTSAAETISIALSGVGDLYKCIGEDLTSLLAKQPERALPDQHQHKYCVVDQALVGLKKVLEACDASREITLRMKEACRDLRFSLFQSAESSISAYACSRKNIIKRAKELLHSLKIIEMGSSSFDPSRLRLQENHSHSVVISMLTCICIIHVSILESLLGFFAIPVTKCRKLGLISKLLSNTKSAAVDWEDHDTEENRNELKDVDLAISSLCSGRHFGVEEEKIRLVCKRLESCETGVQGIENGLDSVSSQLTQARATLLKIFAS